MFKIIKFITVLLVSGSVWAQTPAHYISDSVYIYIHGGPGTEYRIIGSVEAGEAVTFTGQTSGDYSQIIDPKNREGWVRSEFVTDKPSVKERFAEVEAELIKVNNQFNELSLSTDNATQDLAAAQEKITNLQAALTKVIKERDEAKAIVKASIDEQQYEMWRQGGIIAGLGALIGIILVYLPRPQRKKNSRWMS